MALPTSRAEFRSYCLRRLGAPVIEINVSDEQIDDRIDDALQYYMDYHFDGTEKQYYKYQFTPTDLTNKYITLPDNIIGAVNIFDLGSSISTTSYLFDIRYQMIMNDLYNLTNVSMVPFYIAVQHLQLLEQLLIGKQPIRYNRRTNKLYIDMDWNRVGVGDWLIVEAYQIVDPDDYPKVWADRWLLEYGTALIKRQWGEQTKKYKGMMMPGGVQFSGQDIWNEAVDKIEQLEHEMINSYSLPVSDMIG